MLDHIRRSHGTTAEDRRQQKIPGTTGRHEISLLRSSWLAAIVFSLLAHAQNVSDGPTSHPILRIDSVMHTSRLHRIATDSRGRWVVTASEDLTARIWDVSTGRLVRVLRPPIDDTRDEDVGQSLQAMAISPDGNVVAVGGYVGRKWLKDGKFNVTHVFLFDRSSGRLLRRLEIPLRDAHWYSGIRALNFSPTARMLGVAMDHEGIRIYDIDSGREVGRDDGTRGGDYLEFTPDGRRLIWAKNYSEGGSLYVDEVTELGMTRVAATDDTRGTVPKNVTALRISPDGRLVALAGDNSIVRVLDSDTLRVVWQPDIRHINGDDGINTVAWSSDGRLYGTGSRSVRDKYQIRIWNKAKGTFTDLSTGAQLITDMSALPDNRMLFANFEPPAWGMIAADGRSLETKAVAEIINFRGDDYFAGRLQDGFSLSSDGSIVKFGYEKGTKAPTIFGVGRGILSVDAKSKSGLASVNLAMPGIDVDIQDPNTVKLNGRPLPIKYYTMDQARPSCIAIASDIRHFVLCSRQNILYFDATGKEVWHHTAPGAYGLAANISADGRWVVAGFADGTIRWFRSTDGTEELALFMDADRKRWVLWTPSGFYDAECRSRGLDRLAYKPRQG
jgi:WD40 repeat protein